MNIDLNKYGQYKKDIFLKLNFPFEEQKNLIDIGCGDGSDSLIFRDEYKLNVTSTDIYEHPNIKKLGLVYTKSSVLDLPYPDEAFDYVFLHDVLHHIDENRQDPKNHLKALAEIKRIVKNSGVVIIIEGNRYNPLFYPHMVKIKHHEHFTQEYFQNIVKEIFPNIQFKFFESHFYPKKHIKFWKIYEHLMEKYAPTGILAYNCAICGK